MSRLLFFLPVLVFAVVAGHFAWPILTGKDPRILASAMIDKPAPPHDLPALLTEKPGIDPKALRGEVKLVNFFASWCGPCRVEHPLLMQMAAESDIPLLGVNYKDAPDQAKAWLVELGDPFGRIGIDDDGRAAIDWGVYGVPETYLVDEKGQIRYRHVGPLTGTVLQETIFPMVQALRKGQT